MKSFHRLLYPVSLILFFLSANLSATDLKFSILVTRAYWENETEDNVSVEIENANVLPAIGYSVSFEIKDWNNTVVYQDVVEPEPIQPFTKLLVTSNLKFSPSLTGYYTLTGKIDFIDDIDTSNNTASAEFPVVWGLDVAVSKFQNWSLKLCTDPEETWGFMPQKPLPPGTEIESEDETEYKITMDSWKYYGYLDCNKSARYSHLGYAFTMDAIDSSQIDTVRINYWTKIDGIDYMPGLTARQDTVDAVVGQAPQFEEVESSETVSNQSTPEPADSVCALLVSGEGSDESEQRAFDFDVEIVKNNLMFESLGPKLAEGNIEVLNNPSNQELCDAIEGLSGNYRKLTFYYSGHGWLGGLVTKDDSVKDWPSYYELSKKLKEAGIKELEFVIDACHSGAAINFFDSYRWRECDVTIITACAEDTVSYTRRLFVTAGGDTIRVGAYTWFLMKCFGDPAADKDSVTGVSWKEAFEWVRSRNENFGRRNVNRDLMPQLYIHKAEPPRRPVTIPRDTDIEFTSEQPDTTATYYFDMRTDFKDFSTSDSTIAGISDYRYWSYSSNLLEGSYKFDLQFNYSELDTFTTEGEPGLLFRDSSGVEWEVYEDYTWNEDSSYVKGFEIDKYGDFALGTIKVVVDVKDEILDKVTEFALHQNYPNPFNPSTKIKFSIPIVADVIFASKTETLIKVYDILGNEIATLVNEKKSAGNYEVEFNAGHLSSGVYFYRIIAGDFVESRKMMLLK